MIYEEILFNTPGISLITLFTKGLDTDCFKPCLIPKIDAVVDGYTEFLATETHLNLIALVS